MKTQWVMPELVEYDTVVALTAGTFPDGFDKCGTAIDELTNQSGLDGTPAPEEDCIEDF